MQPDPPLEYMLHDHPGPAAGRDELAAIVARSGRQRTRLAAAGVAAALLIGGVAGWGVARRNSDKGRVQTATALGASPSTTIPPGAKAVQGAVPIVGSLTFKRIFVRTTADGVTVRGFETSFPKPTDNSSCMPSLPVFESELSTPAMAASFITPAIDASTPVAGSVGIVGQPEQAPVYTAVAKAGAGIVLVRIHFADGSTDEMSPVAGWVALAHIAPANLAKGPTTATLEGLDGRGKVVASAQLDQTNEGYLKPSPACPLPAPPPTLTTPQAPNTSIKLRRPVPPA